MLELILVIGLQTAPSPPDRQAWANLAAKEEVYGEKVEEHLHRLSDAQDSLRIQITRIDDKKHLDFAALRVEQILKAVADLDRTLTALDQDYARLPEPDGPDKNALKDRVAQKRDRLADLMASITPTRKALVRLIHALENEREARSPACP